MSHWASWSKEGERRGWDEGKVLGGGGAVRVQEEEVVAKVERGRSLEGRYEQGIGMCG